MDAVGVEVLKAVLSLAQALIWPLIVLFVVLYFGRQVKGFLRDAGEFSFKAGAAGFEATAKRQQIEAAAALGAAAAKRQAPGAEPQQGGTPAPDAATREIADIVSEATRPRAARRLAGASVLWVDDRPENNTYERRALEALGLAITLSRSTDDALEKLPAGRFDVVITDMGRPGDRQAGYTLLEALRRAGSRVPVIIYSSSGTPEERAQARQRGAFGRASGPQDLIQLVVSAIQAE
ncbi:MAG: response regulator [Chloroflexota bacterium]